jgi:hypothetical protein
MALSDALAALANLSSKRLRAPDALDPISEAEANHAMLQDEVAKNLAKRGRTFATGATETDLGGDENDPWVGTAARAKVAKDQAAYEGDVRYNSPDATQQRNDELANMLAVPNAKAAGDLAVQKEVNAGKIAEQNNQNANTQELLESANGGGQGGMKGMAGPGGTIKPTINANGGVSFTTTPMPALVQRARNQLLDAHSKTLEALQQAEKLYQGINAQVDSDEAQGPEGSTSFMSFLTGNGAPKYGSAMDMMKARAERAKYDWGIPTPFSELAQSASFGNIEQMAGQLPGVRGLATITPLFREHQSKWGHETPYQTVRRLHGMAKMMEDTIQTLDTSGASAEEGVANGLAR